MIGAKVSISRVKIRAAVSVVDTQLDTTYVLPVAGIKYIKLKVASALDVLNKNPFVADSAVVLDTSTLLVAKQIYDAVGNVDTTTYFIDKALAENVSFLDSVNVLLIFVRDFADSVGVSDSVARAYLKSLVDTANAQDNDTFSAEKHVSDGVAMHDGADATDGNVTNVAKYLMNMAFTSDDVN